MSTKTEHLGLHQWEPEDPFLREDFNGDFAKIDAGVKAVDTALADLEADLAATGASGTYRSAPDEELNISLGFRPRLVVLAAQSYSSMGIVLDGIAVISSYEYNATGQSITRIPFTDDGFTLPAKCPLFNGVYGQDVYYAAFR